MITDYRPHDKHSKLVLRHLSKGYLLMDSRIGSEVCTARRFAHELSGLLTGISAAVYCAKQAESTESIRSYIARTEAMVDNAQKVLSNLHSVLYELDRHAALKGCAEQQD